MESEITFTAIFVKASTTVDQAWRVTLDVGAQNSEQIMQLSQLRDVLLQVAIIPVDPEKTKI